MKKNLKYFFVLTLLISAFNIKNFAQVNTPVGAMLIADSVASGNFKDVLTSYFKLSFLDLTGPNKGIKFSSNLFAYMLKHNPTLDIDTNYVKYKLVRNTNIDLDLKLNDESKFSGFTFGIKHAIVNRRDYTVSKEFIAIALSKFHDLFIISDALSVKASTLPAGSEERRKFNEQVDRLFNDTSFNFNKADPSVQKIAFETAKEKNLKNFLQLVQNKPDVCLSNQATADYEEIINSFQNKALWTAAANFHSYDDRFEIQTVGLSTEFVKGFINPDAPSNLEINIKGNMDFGDDTSSIASDLKRTVINWDAGLNWVMKGWNTNQSFLEFKLSASDHYIISGLYADEEKNHFTLNGTLRFRVSNDLSFPIEFKYDPVSHTILGFLNITSNFNWLGAIGK